MPKGRFTIRQAEQLVAQGKYERAIDVYKDILVNKPDDTSALNAVGDLFIRIGEEDRAVPFFLRAANNYEAGGFRKKAIAILRKAHRQAPTEKEVVEHLSNLYNQEGLLVEARALLLDLARHHHSLGHTKEARRAFEKVIEIDPHSIPSLLKISELAAAENDTEAEYTAYVAVGKELAAAGRLEEALKLLDQAHRADPKHVGVIKLLADLMHKAGNTDGAKELYQALLKQTPDEPEALAAMGEIALDEGDRINAGELFHQAGSSDQSCDRVALLGGRIAAANQDFDTALDYLAPVLDALTADDENHPVVAALEELAEKAPDHLPSLRRLEKLFTSFGNKPRLVTALTRLADALEREEDYSAAIEVAEQLQGIEPRVLSHKARLDRLYEHSRGTALFGSPDAETATGNLQMDQDSVLAAPDFFTERSETPEIKRILMEAYVFLRYGLRDKAKERVSAGLSVLSDDPELHERLAFIQQEEGEIRTALESYSLAAKIWEKRKNFKKAEEINHKIAQLSAVAEKAAQPPTAEVAEEIAPEEPLAKRLAEASYYLDQRFISAAHRVLIDLRNNFSGQPNVEELWERLRSMVSIELDTEDVGKDIDDFFIELEEEAAGTPSPAAGGPPLSSISDELAEELYALHSAAEQRHGSLKGVSRKVDAERILSHTHAERHRQSADEAARIHFELGTAYLETGLVEEAITEFQMAAEDSLFHQKSCLQLGVCFQKRGMDGTAAEWLQRGLTAGGDERIMTDTLFQLALAYKSMGKDNQLQSVVDQLRAMDPEHPGLNEIDG